MQGRISDTFELVDGVHHDQQLTTATRADLALIGLLSRLARGDLRLPTRGGLYAWEFEKDGRELRVHVDGQLVFNGTFQMLDAALAGLGLAYVPEDLVLPHLAKGRLRRVLEDWSPAYSGLHLYYPSRRQPSAAFALVVDALRLKG